MNKQLKETSIEKNCSLFRLKNEELEHSLWAKKKRMQRKSRGSELIYQEYAGWKNREKKSIGAVSIVVETLERIFRKQVNLAYLNVKNGKLEKPQQENLKMD